MRLGLVVALTRFGCDEAELRLHAPPCAQDFSSLYQPPRSEAQEQSFRRGLSTMNYLYCHQLVYLWAQTKMPPGTAAERDYWARGWVGARRLNAGPRLPD